MALNKRRFPGSMVALLLVALAASAQAPYVDIERRLTAGQLHETGLDRLSATQLAALNRLLRGEAAIAGVESRATPVAATAPDATTIARVPAPAAESAPASPGAPRPVESPTAPGNLIGLNDAVIRSRLSGTVDGWEPGTVFALENGQRWKVLKGSVKLRTPARSPGVLVVPGIAGRWFLQVDEDYPKARVYRID